MHPPCVNTKTLGVDFLLHKNAKRKLPNLTPGGTRTHSIRFLRPLCLPISPPKHCGYHSFGVFPDWYSNHLARVHKFFLLRYRALKPHQDNEVWPSLGQWDSNPQNGDIKNRCLTIWRCPIKHPHKLGGTNIAETRFELATRGLWDQCYNR